jgi:hypothetical protein
LTATWQVPDGTGRLVPFPGRFRIDPYEVTFGGASQEGLNVTQTWFYCDARQVPTYPDPLPGLHDLLMIRSTWYEIVQLDTDDLGELGYRLLKAAERLPASALVTP